MKTRLYRYGAALLCAAVLASACDPQKIAKLEEGVSTEDDVRAQFGEPEAVYEEADGARTFEYARQPEGQKNYMITIGTDGRMTALRQVLRPDVFTRIEPGMDKQNVRRLIGRAASMRVFELKNEEVWEWRFLDGAESKRFAVTFDTGGKVVGTAITADNAEGQVGGR
jgi:hypothetical protein